MRATISKVFLAIDIAIGQNCKTKRATQAADFNNAPFGDSRRRKIILIALKNEPENSRSAELSKRVERVPPSREIKTIAIIKQYFPNRSLAPILTKKYTFDRIHGQLRVLNSTNCGSIEKWPAYLLCLMAVFVIYLEKAHPNQMAHIPPNSRRALSPAFMAILATENRAVWKIQRFRLSLSIAILLHNTRNTGSNQHSSLHNLATVYLHSNSFDTIWSSCRY